MTSNVDPHGQFWLPGVPVPCCNRVVDVCLRKLCQTFCEQCPPPTVSPLPSGLDDISLACLLLAHEWGNRFPEATSAALAACLDKVAGRFWGDLLPWQLALEFCRHNPRGVSGLEDLTVNLHHHNSSIRRWMFDLAWCVRHRLNPIEATVRLLKNVADTLGHRDSALGLCRALFPTDEAFFGCADKFQAKEFADQYRERLDIARERGLAVFQQCFERMELRLRRIISESALGLTPDEEPAARPTPRRAAPPKRGLQPASASFAPGVSASHRELSATSALKRPEGRAPVPIAHPPTLAIPSQPVSADTTVVSSPAAPALVSHISSTAPLHDEPVITEASPQRP